MKVGRIAIIAVLLACLFAPQAMAGTDQYVGQVTWVEQVQVGQKTETYIHSGSCVAVDIGSKSPGNFRFLLTAAHVVRGTNKVAVTIQGKSFSAEVIQVDAASDIAYLLGAKEAGTLVATPISTLVYQLGSVSFTAIGYVQGHCKQIAGSIGEYKQYSLRDSGIPNSIPRTLQVTGMKFSGACEPGMSGGGVFDSEGRLKGIIVAGDGKMSVFIPWGKAIGTKPANK